MRITLVYFSQTGNTLKIAEAMAGEFERAGHTALCIPIREARPDHFTRSDLIGLGTPTFESHAPTPVLDFVRSLPPLSGLRSFAFATCGGAAGNVLSDLTRQLEKKGSEVIDSFLALGEVHHPAPCIRGKSAGCPNKGDLTNAKRFAATLCQRFGSGSESRYGGLQPRRGFYTLVGKIAGSEALIRRLEPKPILDLEKCRRCQRCSRECPTDNITMNPTPTHAGRCIRCYRCIQVCEHDAYRANWWFGNLVVWTLWNRHFMRWFGEYEGKQGADKSRCG